MRIIDADALMPLFMKKANTIKDRHGVKLGEEWLLNYKDIKDVIDNAPTVDTTCPNCDSGYAQGYSDGYLTGKEERPQGEWLDEQFVAFHLTCNKCGCNIRRQKDMVFEGEYNYNFCPNCGADMRGGRE